MSADNWAICPKCHDDHIQGMRAVEVALQESYGKEPPEVWLQHKADVEALVAKLEDETFREDYEIYGAAKGSITVSYSGACSVCKLSISFSEKHSFWPVQS